MKPPPAGRLATTSRLARPVRVPWEGVSAPSQGFRWGSIAGGEAFDPMPWGCKSPYLHLPIHGMSRLSVFDKMHVALPGSMGNRHTA
jgi:hypothetical protein